MGGAAVDRASVVLCLPLLHRFACLTQGLVGSRPLEMTDPAFRLLVTLHEMGAWGRGGDFGLHDLVLSGWSL